MLKVPRKRAQSLNKKKRDKRVATSRPIVIQMTPPLIAKAMTNKMLAKTKRSRKKKQAKKRRKKRSEDELTDYFRNLVEST